MESPPRLDEDDIRLAIVQTQFQKKKELNLSSRGIAELPAELQLIVGLRKLSLSHNLLSALPPWLGTLTSLKVLTLYTNKLKYLPGEIGRLHLLERLLLSHNQLRALPPEIVRLTALAELSLNSNQFSHFPPQIAELPNLRELYLSNNQIRTLPSSIRNLSLLERLYLDANQLRALPGEIGHLSALRRLYLYKNQLSSLPNEIGSLLNLKRLYLHYNFLTRLPPTLENLQSMELLDLFNNPLRWADEGKIKRRSFPTLLEMSATVLVQRLDEEDEWEDRGRLSPLPGDLLEFLSSNARRCDGRWCSRLYLGSGVEKTVRKEWKGLAYPVVETYCSFACVLLRGTKGTERKKRQLKKKVKKSGARGLSPPLSVSPEERRSPSALELRHVSPIPLPRLFGSPPRARGYLSN